MAYVAPHYVLSWQFTITGTDELALTTLKVGDVVDVGLDAPTDAMATDVSEAMETFLNGVGFGWASYSRYVGAKVALVDVNGKYTAEPAEHALASPIAGSVSGIAPQSTIVASLRSGETLGKGNYGRMYLPHCGNLSGSSPYYAADRAAVATGVADLIEDVNDVFNVQGAGVIARIYSQALQTGGTRSAKPVAEVGIGRVIDTQRRRRSALTEDYVFSTVS